MYWEHDDVYPNNKEILLFRETNTELKNQEAKDFILELLFSLIEN